MTNKKNILEEKAIELENRLLEATTDKVAPPYRNLLKFFYENYHNRFLQDNKQIWDNGKILVPFSLSAFGFYANLKSPELVSIIVLAFASILLAFVWLINAENHRAFQNKSFVWMRAIERILLGPDVKVSFKISDDSLNEKLSQPAAVNMTIRYFTIAVTLGWVFILLFHTIKHPT